MRERDPDTWQLPRLIGLRRAQELILTNRWVGAEEAERIGLVTRVVDAASLSEEGARQAVSLARGPNSAWGASRALLLQSSYTGYEDQMAAEAWEIALAGTKPEGREGIAAFLEKRPPL